MEQLQLEAALRENAGTPAAIRRDGQIPAIVYGKQFEPINVMINYREFEKALTHGARTHVLSLSVSGGAREGVYPVMVKEIQMNAVKGQITHVDFQRISLKDKVHALVGVHLIGDDDVEKRGGIIQHQMRQVEVECLPTDIPDRVSIDITGFNVGDHITIGDLKFPEGVVAVEGAESMVITIVQPRHVEDEEKAADAESKNEPEVIGKKAEDKEKA